MLDLSVPILAARSAGAVASYEQGKGLCLPAPFLSWLANRQVVPKEQAGLKAPESLLASLQFQSKKRWGVPTLWRLRALMIELKRPGVFPKMGQARM